MADEESEVDIWREFLIAILLHNEAVADRLGLQVVDVAALVLLEMRGPLPVGAIAEELALPSATTTRVIDRLERAGYVRRVRGERDRRTVIVELREGGLDDYEAAAEPSRRHLFELGAHYTEEQVPLLLDIFVRLAGAYRSATGELRATPTRPRRRARADDQPSPADP
ncbi:MarR family winged helix-turn-helix transcriptional regulator [Bailinhaonella thermotolerans]|uniref:MarR family winged helix-turn-helix transcriptional regulator n=1 Tax=Bailinhaonella thermotolerans TaxID=1070861 RepID=UPI00192A25D0|nr:MarR family transcriptional regulator [Bailinhaonella thermotolerans]